MDDMAELLKKVQDYQDQNNQLIGDNDRLQGELQSAQNEI